MKTAAGIIVLATATGAAVTALLIRRYGDQVSPDATIPLGLAIATIWASIVAGAILLMVLAL